MPIRTVNGRDVYIIDAPPVEQAKTSAGVGYAQLMSQLRWKIYEEAKETVLQQMELEKMGYKAQLDAYEKSKDQLQRSLAKAKDLKARVASGELSMAQAVGLAKADANFSLANQRLELQKAGTRRETYTQAKDKRGRPMVDENGDPVFIESYSQTRPDIFETYTDAEGNEASRVKKEFRGPGGKPSDRVTGIAEDLMGLETPEGLREKDIAAKEAAYKAKSAEWNKLKKESGIKKGADFAKSEAGRKIEEETLAAEKARDEARASSSADYRQAAEEMNKGAAQERKGELTDIESAIQAELDKLVLPSVPVSNLGVRAREEFAGAAGVGAFGLQRRPRRISPVYEDTIAKANMAQATGYIDELAAQKYDKQVSELQKRKQNRIAELESLMGSAGTPVGGGIAGAGDQVQKAIGAEIAKLRGELSSGTLNEAEVLEAQSLARKEAQRELASGLLDVGPGPRTDWTFMTRDRVDIEEDEFNKRQREDRERKQREDRGRRKRGGKEEPPVITEIAPELNPLPEPPYQPAVSSELSGFPLVGGVSMIPGSGGILPPVPPPAAPSDGGSAAGGGAAGDTGGGAPIQPPPPVDPSVAGAESTPSGGTGPRRGGRKDDFVDVDVDADPVNNSSALYTYAAPEITDPITGRKTLAVLTNEQKEVIWQKWLAQGERKIASMKFEEVKAWYKKTIEELYPSVKTGKVEPKTRQDRSAAYALKIVNKGKELADKPAKLARLAKTDLPEAERMNKVPEHIALVDKLYEINKTKADVYKTTYSEIARVYEKQPRLRDAALEYLVAKNLLYGNIS